MQRRSRGSASLPRPEPRATTTDSPLFMPVRAWSFKFFRLKVKVIGSSFGFLSKMEL